MTTTYGPMVDVGPPTRNGDRLAECPSCGTIGIMDHDQYRGLVSADCPNCDYHETHDYRNEADDE